MPIYIRFANNKQIETTTLESKPTWNDWYEAPKNFDWQKKLLSNRRRRNC